MLAGEGGWTEIEGCPIYTNDDIATANQQLADVTGANPDLDAFILVGGWAQFGPRGLCGDGDAATSRIDSKETGHHRRRHARLPDGHALKAGHSHVQVGQRPFEMGHEAPDVLIKLIKGETVEDPLYTGLDECTKENADTCVSG